MLGYDCGTGLHSSDCSDNQLRRLAPITNDLLLFQGLLSNFKLLFASPFTQKLDVEPHNPSSSEGSTVDIRPPGDGVDSVELEAEESLDPEACFTEGEGGYVGEMMADYGWWELSMVQERFNVKFFHSTFNDLE